MKLNLTCKEAAALVIAREDRALKWADRLRLRTHLTICAACPRFEAQVTLMRQAMKAWRHYEEK